MLERLYDTPAPTLAVLVPSYKEEPRVVWQTLLAAPFGAHRQCGVTFWVGANALIRRRALEDIKDVRTERGHTLSIYIQNRTLIEDTESSIDLIEKGWALLNYPERLAYSATPRDFGSLLIQRRRWANGGLLILPKLLRHTIKAPKTLVAVQAFLMRFHYPGRCHGSHDARVLLPVR